MWSWNEVADKQEHPKHPWLSFSLLLLFFCDCWHKPYLSCVAVCNLAEVNALPFLGKG